MRCYLASSWKNSIHATAVTTLRERGLDVYDYRNPPDRAVLTEADLDGPSGFLKAARTMEGNFRAILAADFVIAVLPGGASTHVEIGYALAAQVPTFAYYIEEPRRDAFHVYLPRIQDLHRYNFTAAVNCFHKGTVPAFRVPEVNQ
jgi:nucleoside 2-deoxyribosyltransferase